MADSLTAPMATYVAGNAAVSDRRAAGFLWATLSVLIFSGWFVITRFSVTRELGIWEIMALRFGGGALVLAPIILSVAARPVAPVPSPLCNRRSMVYATGVIWRLFRNIGRVDSW